MPGSRRRASPSAAYLTRLFGAAMLAYLVAMVLPFKGNPVLAPLSALLVVEVTLYQTLRGAVRRVGAVIAGVLIAVGVSELFGFTWWSLGLTILAALLAGRFLRLYDHLLEVPISAMLVLSVGSASFSTGAATGRVVETALGAAAGMLVGLVHAPVRMEPAAEAIAELWRKLARLIDQMAAGAADGTFAGPLRSWLRRSRDLAAEIRRVDELLRAAEESVRLNPRGIGVAGAEIGLRHSLETLELSSIIVRGIARALADSVLLVGEQSMMRDPEVRHRLADVLRTLAIAMRDYARAAADQATGTEEPGPALELDSRLATAAEQQARLSQLLRTSLAERPVGWPIRGELISLLDRLRHELRSGAHDSGLA